MTYRETYQNGLVLPGGLRELALFAGAGGGILGGALLGWRTCCAVEINPYARKVLLARQRDGALPRFPIWDDVRTFRGEPWRGHIDVISGGFPCQDVSVAGKGAGLAGARSGLWSEFARIIREVEPRYVFVENSPMLASRGLDIVLGDLASMGFDAKWGVLGAVHAGAPHRRERIWIVATHPDRALAHTYGARQPQSKGSEQEQRGRACNCGAAKLPHAHSADRQEQRRAFTGAEEYSAPRCGGWWEAEPRVGRVVDGLPARMDRLATLGNGQVPAAAALAWRILTQVEEGH